MYGQVVLVLPEAERTGVVKRNCMSARPYVTWPASDLKPSHRLHDCLCVGGVRFRGIGIYDSL